MNKLEKIAERLLLDLEASPSLDTVAQRGTKIDLIKDAILSYQGKTLDALEELEWRKEQFEKFWKLYGKKVGRAPAEKKFLKLKKVDINQILETVEAFVRSTPEVQYRPHPVTYLNQRRWEDEIPGVAKPVRIPGTRLNTWQY